MIDTSATIHASSVIEPGARIGPSCTVGPFCHIGADVVLGEGVDLKSHVAIAGRTEIGAGTTIWPFASIGHVPQDLKYDGEQSSLVIGSNNRIRESVTMNPGTTGGGMITRVGDDNLFMVNVHVGHDAQIGSGNVFANNVSLAGHVIVEDNVVIGGHVGIHQFCRIGRGAMVGVLAAVVADVIPYGTVMGDAAKLAGMNYTGLKRRGVDRAELQVLRAVIPTIFAGDGTLRERAAAVGAAHSENALIGDIVRFITDDSDRSYCLPDD